MTPGPPGPFETVSAWVGAGDHRPGPLLFPTERPTHTQVPMSDWKSEWKRGMDLFRRKQHQEAIQAYRSALEFEPDRLEVLHSLSVALMHAGELDRAIEVGNRIVELDKNDPFAHTSLSIFYQRKGMIPEAEAEAAKARVKAWRQELKTNPKAPPPKDVTDLDVIQ